MSQTQIILIVAALVVIAFFFWRSMREERRMRASRKARLQAGGDVRKDVLAEEKPEPRVEPQLEDMVDDDEPHEAVQSASRDDLPSEKPPVYERFAEEQKARLEREAARGGRKAGRIAGIEKPPVDHGIQGVLDVTPYEGKTFPLGSMDSLVTQIRQLSLPLPVSLWAKSAEDGLYYPSECLPAEAVHIVATILLANRAAVLDDVSASSFLQVLEQTAAQNDVDVRTSCDIKTAVSTAVQISRFIHYYDKLIEVSIVPAPREEGLTLEEVTKVAEGAGFVSASGRWELRIDEGSREPLMTLSLAGADSSQLRLSFDVPLANVPRGDLKRFFQLANHIACHLGGVWVDGAGNRIEAAGGLILQDEIEHQDAQMAASGVRPGSERARLLFSRSA